AIMDSDDLMHHTRLAFLIEAAAEDGADLAADDLYEFYGDPSRPSQRLLQGAWSRKPFWVDISDYVRVNSLYGSGPALGYLKPIVRTSILLEKGLAYDERLRNGEDYNLVLR